MSRTVAIILLAAAATLCVGTTADEPADRGTMLAAALAAGDAAAARNDVTALRRALAVLEGSGARAEGLDVAQTWRRRLGPKGPPPQRGRGLGPAYRMGTLNEGESVLIEQVFLAGQDARVAVQARARGALRLEVGDTARRAMCAPPVAVQARCRWVPLYTQRFGIRLTNMASAVTPYYLVVN